MSDGVISKLQSSLRGIDKVKNLYTSHIKEDDLWLFDFKYDDGNIFSLLLFSMTNINKARIICLNPNDILAQNHSCCVLSDSSPKS